MDFYLNVLTVFLTLFAVIDMPGNVPLVIRLQKENGEIIEDSVVDVQDIIIDKINIKPLLTKAYFYPEYPEPWLSEQKQSNNNPPEYYGFTTKLHHNGQWRLQFESPLHVWFFQNLNISI